MSVQGVDGETEDLINRDFISLQRDILRELKNSLGRNSQPTDKDTSAGTESLVTNKKLVVVISRLL